MKCNVIFSTISQSLSGDVFIQNPTFSYEARYIPTQFTIGVTIVLGEFEKLTGNTFMFSILNEDTDVIYSSGMEEIIPSVGNSHELITMTTMLNNIDIKSEGYYTLVVFVNGEIIHRDSFYVKKGGS